jgi:hypothetical protein
MFMYILSWVLIDLLGDIFTHRHTLLQERSANYNPSQAWPARLRWARVCHADSAWPGPLTAAAKEASRTRTVPGTARWVMAHAVTPVLAADCRRGGPPGTRKPGRLPGNFTGSQVPSQFDLRAD